MEPGHLTWLSFIHLPERWDLETDGSQTDLFAAACKKKKDWKEIKVMVLTELCDEKITKPFMLHEKS